MYRSKSQGRKTRLPVEGLFCTYSHRVCMQGRLEGYEFCLKHILEDKNSPFKQCSYASAKSGKKCTNAAPKSDRKEGYCLDHSRRALLMRQRASRKKRPKETPELLLEDLDHYSGFGKSLNSGVTEGKKSHGSMASRILEYASSSDSDAETPVVDQAWRGDGESDAESIDSEQEDLLKHAGVHTAEEVALIMRDKLIRLQSLYIDQFKRLQHVMKEKRRKYLHSHNQEKEAIAGLGQYKYDLDQSENYKKLNAMKRYHHRYGKEALLHRQSKQRRIAVSEGVNYKPPSYPRCVCTEMDGKCPSRALPLSRYCLDHILLDRHQVLFRPCSFGDGSCGRPVASTDEVPFCSFHSPLTDFEPRLTLKREPTPEPLSDDTSVTTTATSTGSSVSMAMQSASKPGGSGNEEELDPNSEEALMKKGRLLLQHLQSIDAKLNLNRAQRLASPLTSTPETPTTCTSTGSSLTGSRPLSPSNNRKPGNSRLVTQPNSQLPVAATETRQDALASVGAAEQPSVPSVTMATSTQQVASTSNLSEPTEKLVAVNKVVSTSDSVSKETKSLPSVAASNTQCAENGSQMTLTPSRANAAQMTLTSSIACAEQMTLTSSSASAAQMNLTISSASAAQMTLTSSSASVSQMTLTPSSASVSQMTLTSSSASVTPAVPKPDARAASLTQETGQTVDAKTDSLTRDARQPVEAGTGSLTQVARQPVDTGTGSMTQVARQPVEAGTSSMTQVARQPVEARTGSMTQVARQPVEAGTGSMTQVARQPVEARTGSMTQVARQPVEVRTGPMTQVARQPVDAGTGSMTQDAEEPMDAES